MNFKLSSIKKPLIRQADKFIGEINSKDFKSPSILREGFRMGNFKLITPLLFLFFTVTAHSQQTCDYQEGSFENWTEFVDSSFVEYGFDPLTISFPNFHVSALRVFIIAFAGFTFPEGSQELYDFVSAGYGIARSDDSYIGKYSSKVSGDATIPFADLYSVHPCSDHTDKLTFYLKHVGNSPDTLDIYFFKDTSVTSFPANDSQLLDYPSYIQHRIIKSGTDTSFVKIEIPFTENFESALADTIFGTFIVSGNQQFFNNGGHSYFLIDNVKFEKNGIDNDGDGFNSDMDCDDNNAMINTAAAEIPNNNVDENCDGVILIIDNDGDGFNSDVDCDDNNAMINTAAAEIPNNNVDENCDGVILIIDNDGDGFNSDVDCDDNNAMINTAAAEIPNNNVDENCDGVILIIDNDGDGFNSDVDCDDNNAMINTAATEIPNNNVDENCDGVILIIDKDGDGFNSDVDCDDNNASINTAAAEIPNNNVDENCDGVILIIDNDGDGFNSDLDCDDNNALINSAATEIPNNGIDEDCNGEDLISSTNHPTKLAFSIYPNPTDKFIHIVTGEEFDNIEIINQVGQKLLHFVGKNRDILDVQYLPSGIYVIKVTSKNKMSAHKLFIKK